MTCTFIKTLRDLTTKLPYISMGVIVYKIILNHCYRKSVTCSQNQIFSVDKWLRNKNKQQQQQQHPKCKQKKNPKLVSRCHIRMRTGLEIILPVF